MLVFIDDSGDAGFSIQKGSSRFFVIAAVIFEDELEAEKVAGAIKELRRELKFPEDVEFKFNKSRKTIRTKFLTLVNRFNFKVRCLVIDKKVIYSNKLRNSKNSFYSYAIKQLLKYSDGKILSAKIRVDGSGDRIFKKSFQSYLRRELNSSDKKIMENCKLIDSKENVLIQMADIIAGSIKRAYEDTKNDAKVYIEVIEKKIDDRWEFK